MVHTLPEWWQDSDAMKVIIWDDSKQKVALQIPVLTTVRGVRLTRSYIVVVLQNSVRIYKFQSVPELWAAFETSDNPLGLCCLTAKLVAFPGRTVGQVQVVELEKGNVSIIPAHSSALKAIDISRDGKVLATASTAVCLIILRRLAHLTHKQGTLIRVFLTSNCGKIAELRRGVDYAIIFSVAFSPSGQQLAVTSNKSTLHVFDIPHPSKPTGSESRHRSVSPTAIEEPTQKWGFLGRIPGVPRLFSDTYSFTSTRFEMGDEPLLNPASPDSGPVHPKGIIGWTNEETIIVLGCGQDARWEKFVLAEGDDGKRFCFRAGWKRYLGST